MSEKSLHKSVCDYLRLQYPGVLFNSDLAGSMKLTIGQATAMKALRSNRGFPDLAIYESRIIDGDFKHGLFIELKKEGTKLRNKCGICATPHIQEQWSCITDLEQKGYVARFAVGFDEAKRIIDNYLRA